jgi:hypothetical protein
MPFRFPHPIEVYPMPLVRTSIHLAAALALTASTLAPMPADARVARAARGGSAAFDGQWSVLIVTNRGNCDRAYRYGLSIRNGAVYGGGGAASVSGRVASNGAVHVHVSSGGAAASGSGRLSRNSGHGSWRGAGSMGSCSGSWSAERRG